MIVCWFIVLWHMVNTRAYACACMHAITFFQKVYFNRFVYFVINRTACTKLRMIVKD